MEQKCEDISVPVWECLAVMHNAVDQVVQVVDCPAESTVVRRWPCFWKIHECCGTSDNPLHRRREGLADLRCLVDHIKIEEDATDNAERQFEHLGTQIDDCS